MDPEMVPRLSKEVLTEFHRFSEMSAEWCQWRTDVVGFSPESESDVTTSSLAADLVLRGPLLRRLEKQIQLENIWCFRKSFHACMRDRDRSWGRGWLVKRKWFMLKIFDGYCACKLIRLDLDCFWIWTDLFLWCGANWFWKRVPSVKEDGKTMMRPMEDKKEMKIQTTESRSQKSLC